MKEIAGFFSVHYTTVSKIIGQRKRDNSRPDPHCLLIACCSLLLRQRFFPRPYKGAGVRHFYFLQSTKNWLITESQRLKSFLLLPQTTKGLQEIHLAAPPFFILNLKISRLLFHTLQSPNKSIIGAITVFRCGNRIVRPHIYSCLFSIH